LALISKLSHINKVSWGYLPRHVLHQSNKNRLPNSLVTILIFCIVQIATIKQLISSFGYPLQIFGHLLPNPKNPHAIKKKLPVKIGDTGSTKSYRFSKHNIYLSNDFLYHGRRLYVPPIESLRTIILHEFHATLMLDTQALKPPWLA